MAQNKIKTTNHNFINATKGGVVKFFRKLIHIFRVKPAVALIGFRHFSNEYRLPLVITLVFLIGISSLATVRALEKTSLVSLLPKVTQGSGSYATLLIGDEADQFERGDTSFTQPDEATNDSPAPAGTPTSFALNPGDSSTASSGTSTDNSSIGNSSSNGNSGQQSGSSNNTDDDNNPAPPPFASSIAYFQQNDTTLDCPGIRLVKGQCDAIYTFSAGVNTSNGPGTVQYSWVSSLQSANANGSYNAPSGSNTNPLQRKVTLRCNQTQTFSMQFVVNAPTTTKSSVININHNCDNL